jgi:uncharacterized protein YciI
MSVHRLLAALCALSLCACGTTAGGAPGASARREAPTTFDAELAQRLGADERGMRRYVLVVLKTGPRRMPEGEARQAMFAGHFANMQRLSEAGQLALAGPFMPNEEGWRGLFVFAVETVEEAQALTATDPVIIEGEMVAEYHPWYGSAALMALPDLHMRLQPPPAD